MSTEKNKTITIGEAVKLVSYANKITVKASGATSRGDVEHAVTGWIGAAHSFDIWLCLLRDSLLPLVFRRSENQRLGVCGYELQVVSNFGPVSLLLRGPMRLDTLVDQIRKEEEDASTSI